LLTLDLSDNWRYRIQRQPKASIAPDDLDVANPDYSVPAFGDYNIVSRQDKVRWDIQGLFLRQQTAFWQGRLIGFAGVRFDRVTYDMNFGDQYSTKTGKLDSPGLVDHFTDTAASPSIGLNFKATPHIAIYGNFSKSFYPNAQVAKLGDGRLPNETGRGWDFGIKSSLFDNRLIFTLGGYIIRRDGVKASIKDDDGNTISVAAGSQEAKGIEFDGTWRLSDDLTVLAAYGYSDTRILENGSNVESVGHRSQGVPLDNGAIAVKYNIPGMLKGVALTGGLHYTGMSYPQSYASDARQALTLGGYALVQIGLSYRWKQGSGPNAIEQTIRLSAKNLLDREYINERLNLGEGRGVYLAYTISH
jgi:outer membrane receptor protein involved in Fe transport